MVIDITDRLEEKRMKRLQQPLRKSTREYVGVGIGIYGIYFVVGFKLPTPEPHLNLTPRGLVFQIVAQSRSP